MQNQINITQISRSIQQGQTNSSVIMFWAGFLFSKYKLKTKQEYQILIRVLNQLSVSYQNQSEVLEIITKLIESTNIINSIEQLQYYLQNIIYNKHNYHKYSNTQTQIQINKISTQKLKTRKLSIKQCQICFQSVDINDIIVLCCSDIFHKQCMRKTIETKIDHSNILIQCPLDSCLKQIPFQSISQLLSLEYGSKYQKMSLNKLVQNNYSTMCWCPTIGCQYLFRFKNEQLKLSCPKCSKTYCLNCRVQYHQNITCQEYQSNRILSDIDSKFMQFVSGAKYKQCPQCKYWVEKSQGCDHMTCRCLFQFCYICGSSYPNCDCDTEQEMQRALLALMVATDQLRQINQNLRDAQLQLANLQVLQMLQQTNQINRMGQNILRQGLRFLEDNNVELNRYYATEYQQNALNPEIARLSNNSHQSKQRQQNKYQSNQIPQTQLTNIKKQAKLFKSVTPTASKNTSNTSKPLKQTQKLQFKTKPSQYK